MAPSDEVTNPLCLEGMSAVATGAATGIEREIAQRPYAAGTKGIAQTSTRRS